MNEPAAARRAITVIGKAPTMVVNDANRLPNRAASSAVEPTPPPVDPAERPSIDPTDALPTGEQQDEASGLIEGAKSLFSAVKTVEDTAPGGAASSAVEPTPPPVDPAERPRIEPTDALPTERH